MVGRLRKQSGIKKKGSASQDDLVGKFARMRISSSQNQVLQSVATSNKGKRATANRSNLLKDNFAKMRLSPSSQTLRLPPLILELVTKALVYVDRLKENKDDYWAKEDLLTSIYYMDNVAPFYQTQGRLPRDWKFDAEACRALVS